MSGLQDSSTSSSTTKAKFLTKLLVSIFLGIAFLAVAVTLVVRYYKSRATKRAEAIEMQRLEEAERGLTGLLADVCRHVT